MLLWKLAFRNLFVHRLKTAVTGLIIVFGTTLAIVGNAVVDAISGGMQKSLTNSITGDLQIYAGDAPEKIAVLGGFDGNMPDIGHLNDFRKVKDALTAKVPNVRDVIPMGISQAFFNPGNILDLKLAELRKTFYENPRPVERLQTQKEHLVEIVRDIERSRRENAELLGSIYGGEELFKTAPADIERALSPAFWANFDAHFEERVEFLANRMAPLIFDDNQLFLSYIGTVPELFRDSFSQFEIAKGEMIPEGARGFLFSDYIYENQVKHRVARRLDQIKKQIDKEKRTIKDTKELQDRVAANVAQAAEVYNQLDPARGRELAPTKKRRSRNSCRSSSPRPTRTSRPTTSSSTPRSRPTSFSTRSKSAMSSRLRPSRSRAIRLRRTSRFTALIVLRASRVPRSLRASTSSTWSPSARSLVS